MSGDTPAGRLQALGIVLPAAAAPVANYVATVRTGSLLVVSGQLPLHAVRRVVRLGGCIACTPDFTQHATVMNGASDLAVAVFGEAGRHARSTVGVPSLPLDAPVEVEALFEVDGV